MWREDVFVALVRLTLETLFLALSEIASSCFLFNCLFSALHIIFFFSLLFICLRLTFSVPSLSHLSHALGCFEAAPTGGRQTPFPLRGVPALPRGWGATQTASLRAGRERKRASCCNLLTCFFYCAVLGFFSAILCNKQESADIGTVIFGGTKKVVACLGVLDQNPGVFCLLV